MFEKKEAWYTYNQFILLCKSEYTHFIYAKPKCYTFVTIIFIKKDFYFFIFLIIFLDILKYSHAKTLLCITLMNLWKYRRSRGWCRHRHVTVYGCMTRWYCYSRVSWTRTQCYQKLWICISWLSSHHSQSRTSRSQKKMTTLWSPYRPLNPRKRDRILTRSPRIITLCRGTRTRWSRSFHTMSTPCCDTRKRTRQKTSFFANGQYRGSICHTRCRHYRYKKSKRLYLDAHRREINRKNSL